jgi:hypothetical protein
MWRRVIWWILPTFRSNVLSPSNGSKVCWASKEQETKQKDDSAEAMRKEGEGERRRTHLGLQLVIWLYRVHAPLKWSSILTKGRLHPPTNNISWKSFCSRGSCRRKVSNNFAFHSNSGISRRAHSCSDYIIRVHGWGAMLHARGRRFESQ